MAYILCVETSTTNCSVALTYNDEVIALAEDYDAKYSHAERLHNFMAEIIKDKALSFKDISAIAISKGPGSYTGLRIGVSAAKGLCYALDIPLISIPTLQSLAMQVKSDEEESYIVSMIDARRMEVYAAVFSNTYEQLRETRAEILTEDSFKEYLDKNSVYFIGNGVEKFSEICKHENAIFIQNKLPSAQEMAQIAYEKFLKKDSEDVSYFEPYYLKDFVAG
ncbi:tRNA (adenosine(37)-N6)-threonylcarbamoyltransferase complex dimerization subunit type 1 TsaB [Aquimarina sp. AD10]|uniref:tRNA threonylcarbamoyladenosine biosynthesis protein TsaB n=1 Tax=Aquimarina aggregata TaxID=1642818 RepID=A0A162YPK0_9FLAO|nr:MULTISPECIES: tRNA (adenosine(37)-N6)-threonylcarbamoyltransferase complex dimerization subunit type 1 TsaB [Aquimarina]AXT61174.1 tRNA (adenosine(37)-N6)-threonylcarbamoyltransferase complex dimerization subunit type 1 TsaB [Aquimarina sp. AD10]KZS39269.1 tRNA threonylcarbamoyladenosine biosynthesis protein TsaB [Aquimarina aggregata]RKN02210.1 tRNA (adenosine(37)-N6)-threonylcarbamoyltransferase complex dimerization subunit type 1 TsaB [Aquimarina sp. AD10]